MQHKLAICLGTRPEIIKLAPVTWECDRRHVPYILIHSGQHYDPAMDAVFFKEFGLKKPSYRLSIGGTSRGEQLSHLLWELPPIFQKEKIAGIVIQGDTNTVLGSALAAECLGIPIAHVEAGLRSFDRGMPEETNRVLTDHISSLLFVPTTLQQEFLEREGIKGKQVQVVGNTIADVMNAKQLKRSHTPSGVLLTLHRPSNVDDPKRLVQILGILDAWAHKTGTTVQFPVHPRTRLHLAKQRGSWKAIELMEPLSYSEFLAKEAEVAFIVTDSGGVQEEACILKTPCLTLRTSTERQETLSIGANQLISDLRTFPKALATITTVQSHWKHPYGRGSTSARIVDRLQKEWL